MYHADVCMCRCVHAREEFRRLGVGMLTQYHVDVCTHLPKVLQVRIEGSPLPGWKS